MIRLLLMALGAYTLYRIYAPLEAEPPRKSLADQRPDQRPQKSGASS